MAWGFRAPVVLQARLLGGVFGPVVEVVMLAMLDDWD